MSQQLWMHLSSSTGKAHCPTPQTIRLHQTSAMHLLRAIFYSGLVLYSRSRHGAYALGVPGSLRGGFWVNLALGKLMISGFYRTPISESVAVMDPDAT